MDCAGHLEFLCALDEGLMAAKGGEGARKKRSVRIQRLGRRFEQGPHNRRRGGYPKFGEWLKGVKRSGRCNSTRSVCAFGGHASKRQVR